LVGRGICVLDNTCNCNEGYGGSQCEIENTLGTSLSPARSCLEIHRTNRQLASAVYWIKPSGQTAFQVYCDMDNKDQNGNAGWLVFQRREATDANRDFWNTWEVYKTGFGSQWKSFYLGNTKLSQVTTDLSSMLRIDLFYNGVMYNADYGTFKVGPESDSFRLNVASYLSGPVPGDAFLYHNNRPFTTYDIDLDEYSLNCAAVFRGAYWYGSCHQSNCTLSFRIFIFIIS
jgi:ficolin